MALMNRLHNQVAARLLGVNPQTGNDWREGLLILTALG